MFHQSSPQRGHAHSPQGPEARGHGRAGQARHCDTHFLLPLVSQSCGLSISSPLFWCFPCPTQTPGVKGCPRTSLPTVSQEPHNSISMPRSWSLIALQMGPQTSHRLALCYPDSVTLPTPTPIRGQLLSAPTLLMVNLHITTSTQALLRALKRPALHPQTRGTLPSQSSLVSEKPATWCPWTPRQFPDSTTEAFSSDLVLPAQLSSGQGVQTPIPCLTNLVS